MAESGRRAPWAVRTDLVSVRVEVFDQMFCARCKNVGIRR